MPDEDAANPPDPVYRAAIAREWAEDDAHFRSPDGPLLQEDRETFTGLPHFPVDESWRIRGLDLEPYEGAEPQRFGMAATLGEPRPSVRAGTFRFLVGDTEQRLVAYRFVEEDGTIHDYLFVPFMDGTTGAETYVVGRYLDAERADDGTWTLDFNRAYHPSCAYNPRFSCPITPAENRLAIRVEAGVRLDESAAH
jgi:uncharacterized protein